MNYPTKALLFCLSLINFMELMTLASKADNTNALDISPAIIQESPVLQRWLEEIREVFEQIQQEPSFKTRVRLGYVAFPSNEGVGGVNLGVRDLFLGKTALTLSGDYQSAFNGERESVGADLGYYVLPLGGYINLAPVVGYRYLKTDNYSTDGLNLGVKLMLPLAADITVSQSFVSIGTDNEVGITSFSVGYALTSQMRLAADIEGQNSRAAKDSSVSIVLEWMPE